LSRVEKKKTWLLKADLVGGSRFSQRKTTPNNHNFQNSGLINHSMTMKKNLHFQKTKTVTNNIPSEKVLVVFLVPSHFAILQPDSNFIQESPGV